MLFYIHLFCIIGFINKINIMRTIFITRIVPIIYVWNNFLLVNLFNGLFYRLICHQYFILSIYIGRIIEINANAVSRVSTGMARSHNAFPYGMWSSSADFPFRHSCLTDVYKDALGPSQALPTTVSPPQL